MTRPNVGDGNYYIHRGPERYGPYSEDEFEQFLKENALLPADLVWTEGMAAWQRIDEFILQRSKAVGAGHRIYSALLNVIREPLRLLHTLLHLISQPSDFGKKRIDNGGNSTKAALAFYLGIFSITFVIVSATTFLAFYKGDSEIRELFRLAVQVAFAIPIIYIGSRMFRQKATLSGITETVLYVDAAYLLIGWVVAGAPSILRYFLVIRKPQIDILATEYEACLATSSVIYNAIRGTIQFHLHGTASEWYAFLEKAQSISEYVVVVPFCMLFGYLLRSRYGDRALLHAVLAFVAFFVVVESWNLATSWVQSLVVRSSSCAATLPNTLASKYSKRLLAEQAAFKIDDAIAGSFKGEPRPRVSTHRGQIVLELKQVPRAGHLQVRAKLVQMYCHGRGEFRPARYLNLPINVTLSDETGRTAPDFVLTPMKCDAAN